MTTSSRNRKGFSLVEVVLAIGLVGFSVLATVGLLSVGSQTNKNARDEGLASRLAANEFDRIRSLGPGNFPSTYIARYYDANLGDLGQTKAKTAVYQVNIQFVNPPPAGTADVLMNAEIRFPAWAAAASQSVYRFSTLMNTPKASPTPSAAPPPP